MTQRIPLSQNKEFKSIRNAVLQEALKLSKQAFVPVDVVKDDEQEQSVSKNQSLSNSNTIHRTQPEKNHTQRYILHDSILLASFRLLTRIAQILQEDILKNEDIHSRIEKKVRRRIEEKKMAQGIKPE